MSVGFTNSYGSPDSPRSGRGRGRGRRARKGGPGLKSARPRLEGGSFLEASESFRFDIGDFGQGMDAIVSFLDFLHGQTDDVSVTD